MKKWWGEVKITLWILGWYVKLWWESICSFLYENYKRNKGAYYVLFSMLSLLVAVVALISAIAMRN
jgi:hypothetical protein